MTTTTYYNLNIVEGTDIVNPLTVDNPNYEKIDETMHNNAVAGVTLATEIANATVHAITRENSDCAVIRFIATSRWKAGDTATVDGVPVTALLPSGETLPDGAYVINANVLCILTGTNLTVYVEGNKVENANQIPYNETNVGAELDALNGSVEQINGSIVQINASIGQINSNLTWKLLQSVTGNTPVTLPSDFSELLVEIEAPTESNYSYTFHILKPMLKTTNKRYFGGFYYKNGANGSPSYGTCKLSVSSTTLYLHELFAYNTNVASSCTVNVYYK